MKKSITITTLAVAAGSLIAAGAATAAPATLAKQLGVQADEQLHPADAG